MSGFDDGDDGGLGDGGLDGGGFGGGGDRLTFASVLNAGNLTDLSTYDTANISPGADRWLVVDVASNALVAPNVPTLSGGGFIYTQEATVLGTVGGGTTRRITRFYTWTGAAPGSFQIAIDFAAQVQEEAQWSIFTIDGANLADPFVQSVTNSNSGTAPTVTLAAFASSRNRALAFLGMGATLQSVEGTLLGTIVQDQDSAVWYSADADTTPSAIIVSSEWKIIGSEVAAL